MCDFSGRLIVWMDGELDASEAAALEQHVHACSECRERVVAYKEVSRGFAAYCDALLETAVATKAHNKLPRWAPWAAAAAAIAAVALLLAWALGSVKPAPLIQPAAAARPAVPQAVPEIASRQPSTTPKRHVAAHRKAATAKGELAGPAIRIAIPADAMFPPGAVPAGVNYEAEVSLADGSVQGLRLQP